MRIAIAIALALTLALAGAAWADLKCITYPDGQMVCCSILDDDAQCL